MRLLPGWNKLEALVYNGPVAIGLHFDRALGSLGVMDANASYQSPPPTPPPSPPPVIYALPMRVEINGKLQVVGAGFAPGQVVLLQIIRGGGIPNIIVEGGFAKDSGAFLAHTDLPSIVSHGLYTVRALISGGIHMSSTPLIVVEKGAPTAPALGEAIVKATTLPPPVISAVPMQVEVNDNLQVVAAGFEPDEVVLLEIVMGRDTPNLILQGGFANGAGAFLSDMASTSPTGGLPDILVPGVYTIRARTIQGHVASAPLIIMENVEPRPGELLVPTVTQANGAVATVVENGKLQVVAAGFVPGEVVLLEIVIGGDTPTLILPSGFANDASAFLSINDSLPGAVVPGVYTVKASTIQGHVASAPLIVVATK